MTKISGTLLVGVGGVGSALIQPLAAILHDDPDCWVEDETGTMRLPVLTICDGDEYEEKNLRNQCITEQDVGSNKAVVAACLVTGRVKPMLWDRYLSGPLEIVSWLVSQRTIQARREDAGTHGGVALIITGVDNDHCRKYIYDAIAEVPLVNVLIVDPSNGAGEDADCVDVVTYLRVKETGTDAPGVIEPWPSPMVKYKQLRNPKGRPSHVGCAEKAESLPQLRTSNMMAATLAYDCIERFLNEGGMVEGWAYNREHGLRQVGSRLPTQKEMIA